jgi:CRP-like cAMP-binding protein
MPLKYKMDMMDYIDDLLLPIQSEDGSIRKNELDLICQNISGALFGTINDENLNRIFSLTRTCQKNEIICEQETVGQEMYLIKKGKVGVSINGLHLALLGPGEIFGELSLFYNVKRTATITALKDDTILGVLTREGFETLLKKCEPYSYDLIYRLYTILPERLRNLNDKYKTAIDALGLIADISNINQPELSDIANGEWPEVNLFPKLTRAEAREIFKELKSYDKDQLIFAEGDKADGAYYILEGSVKAIIFSSDGKEVELGHIGEGEVFGEMALIDNMPRSASILTVTPCKAAFINTNDFKKFIESRSDLAFRLMGFICLSLFWRIIRLDKVYADMKKIFSSPSVP